MSLPSEIPRRRFAAASQALEEFRRAALGPEAGEAPPLDLPSPAESASRAALAQVEDRMRALEGELATARADAARLAAENGRLAERLEAGVRAAGEVEELRARLTEAESRAASLRERSALLEAEAVRLESMRRNAERAAAETAAAARSAEDALRRDLRETHAALDQAASAAGQAESRSKGEADALRARLEAAAQRIQAFEREKRMESARAAGDSAALSGELQRAMAAAAALRRELGEERQRAEKRELELLRDLTDARGRVPASSEELAIMRAARDQAIRAAEAAESALREERERSRPAPPPVAPPVPPPAAPPPPPAPVQAAPAPQPSAGPPGEEDWPALDASEAAAPAFIAPPIEPLLDPGWARFLRLVRPPVDAAYAHLRRLSATALTAGQKAVLRLAAASVAQASDALGSVELSLAEGPAASAPADAMPALDAALAAWEPAFRRRGVALAREWSPPLPHAVCDPRELRVLVFHVLRNVLEAVPGGGRLTVRASRDPDGGLRVEFVDDGPGFPAAWLERRFEPFASPRRGRAGLGLALVRRTLRRWGGDAEAANGPAGRGARLTWTFPAPPPAEAPRP